MATSKLQKYVGDLLDREFPQFRIRENYRPDWLLSSDKSKLELDLFIEELNIAFEIQGRQHYDYVPFFHKTIEGFEKRKRFDNEKKDLCYGRGISLIEIFTTQDALIAVSDIKERISPKVAAEKYFYSEESNLKGYFEKKKRTAQWVSENKKNEKENNDIFSKEYLVKFRSIDTSKSPIRKELKIYCDVVIREYKKNGNLQLEYKFHKTEIPKNIMDEIKTRLPLCENGGDVLCVFIDLMERS